jgi:ribosomal protein S18
MKQIIVFTVLLTSLLSPLLAQPNKGKIDALKIAFITKRLNLSEEEAQKFWPVYNKYEDEKDAIRESTVGQYKEEQKPIDELSDADADKMINDFIAFRSKDVDLLKKYVVEFKKILPVKKVAKLITAEDHFKKMLLKQAQQDGQPGGPPRPGNKPMKAPGGQ